MAAKRKRSRITVTTIVDGRSVRGRLLRATRAELVALVGGNPSPDQQMMIDMAGPLRWRLRQMEIDHLNGQPIDDERYLAALGAFRRILDRLDLNSSDDGAATLNEAVERSASQRAHSAA